MKNILCKICGKGDISGLNGIKGYYFCSNCKVAWMKKFPKAEYEEEYYKGKSGFASKLFVPISNLLYLLRRKYVHKKNPKVWVDVGAGEGGFLVTVKAKKRIGVEVSKAGRQIMKQSGLEAINEKEFLKIKSLNADVISFWHVLEHLENPWDYLKAANRNLNKNGVLVIGVPNIDSWEFGYFRTYWFHLAPKYHLWHFSPNSMEVMLERAGFKVVSINYWSPEHTIAGLLQSFINKSSGTDAVLHKLVKRELSDGNLPIIGIIWSLVWVTIGLPIIFGLWIIHSLRGKSGTFVIVGRKN